MLRRAWQGNQRLYNPYEGIGAAVDGRKGTAFRLPSQPEFLFSEEAAVHHRSWSENLTYYTGSGYLTGAPPCCQAASAVSGARKC